ncbi:N-acetylmuramoyl-L-alanine amidase [Thalassotalea sp. LPB0316]|uniref:N-acetylmuramoyl-L-alanine amidase n=1 Tax=Thalassotalea sp. LPB0316 TaxID=2769490 RepID=UPI0018676DDC|nr:N-acetylmuramoyl-L-alanine amidase [Thalassotalea sp. LPB0316]QOL26531.1 N-acetylmuramoyl-L-alanine amidase [Thalassotalea sp. LPB0316]
MNWQRQVSKVMRFVFCSLVLMSFGANAVNTIDSVRVWPAPENTRVVFDLSEQPEYTYFSLSAPHRLVIDFKDSKRNVNLSNIGKNDPRIKKIRTSNSKETGTTRLVLELNASYRKSVFPLAPAGQYGHRLVIDLFDKEQKTHIAVKPPTQQQDIVIGIDAGHGGEDPGSVGHKGTYEKHVTLAIAKRLKTLIDQEKGLKAELIRSGDYYIHVNDRSRIARKKNVDFLVSIHADAFHTPQPSGGSVWLVTNRRVESELARWLVNREKNSELLGGGGSVIKNTDDDNLAITIADMSKEYSLEVSHGVASHVISRMRKITKMHKRTPQNGNFAVLKASDIPSILVETGFISNHQEERNLTSPSHQQKLAQSIFDGIRNYYLDNPPAGSYYATIAIKKHTVSRGESLSVLAQRYNVSVSKLKKANNLDSNVVKVGQTLKIPRAD